MAQVRETSWIPSVCYMCYNCCSIRVKKLNGVVVDIEGDANSPYNAGKLCAKGKASIMGLYDPYRVLKPLKRTNPEKGLDVDPCWQEISWDEALQLVTEKLVRVKKDDPRKLVIAGIDFRHFAISEAFASAFGTPNLWRGGVDYFCGNALHSVLYLTNGTFQAKPDLDYCNYCLLIGNQLGFMVGSNAVPMTSKMAEARARGMKLVVVDPVCTSAGSKADEWVPIRPGTDGALALALLNLLLNELNVYDAAFLRQYTNGPYLVGPDGLYARDPGTGHPLVWNFKEEKSVSYRAGDSACYALEGSYHLDGRRCMPAFQVLKDHVKRYTPEFASAVTTVPVDTIRRIAQEFGQAAKVGSKLVIKGKELPYRPVVANWSRGAISHKHAMHTALAIQLLNIVVGAMDVPGGQLGSNPLGPWWSPKEGPDGLMVPADIQLVVEGSYPARKVKAPDTLSMMELFPIANYSCPLFEEAILNPEKFHLAYKPEVMVHIHSNLLMGTAKPARIAEVLKRIPFIISFVSLRDETTDFSDLVLPDAHYLERCYPFPNHPAHFITEGMGSWYWMMGQPVVEPAGEARPWPEIILELSERLGIRADLYQILNQWLNLKEPHRLDPGRSYSWEEVADVQAKSRFGPDHDLSWFKENGFFVSSPKTIEEAYPRPFLKPRIPVYFEHLIGAGNDVKKVTEELGIPWDISDYQPVPDWKPCPEYGEGSPEYDLYPVNYKIPFHTFSVTTANPWLNELGEHHPSAYKVLINKDLAQKKGLSDGDEIWLESKAGKVKGKAKLTECIHPEAIGIGGTFGHWAKGVPVGRGKGVHFNSLLLSNLERIDLVTAALDCCAKVKVYKA